VKLPNEAGSWQSPWRRMRKKWGDGSSQPDVGE